jgi:hypothetical protein
MICFGGLAVGFSGCALHHKEDMSFSCQGDLAGLIHSEVAMHASFNDMWGLLEPAARWLSQYPSQN